MCGVVGYWGRPNEALLTEVLLQNNIRGQHATGVSFIDKGGIATLKQPGCAKDFVSRRDVKGVLAGPALICHSRYSTSSLEFNQPIANTEVAVSHNGVITQEEPDRWEDLYGYQCRTQNDSELLLHAFSEGIHPLEKFPEASIATCILTPHKLTFFRNGKRPLWFVEENGYTLVVSTKDIAARCGLSAQPCEPFVHYEVGPQGITSRPLCQTGEDLQDACL